MNEKVHSISKTIESPMAVYSHPSPLITSNCLDLRRFSFPPSLSWQPFLAVGLHPLSMCPIHFLLPFTIELIMYLSSSMIKTCAFSFLCWYSIPLSCCNYVIFIPCSFESVFSLCIIACRPPPLLLQSASGHTQISVPWSILLQPLYPFPDALLLLWQAPQCRY